VARVVIGFPTFRSEDTVGATLDALLSLDYPDYAIVSVDDASPDRTYEIARGRALLDSRLDTAVNERRRGMVRNWNRIFERAVEIHPEHEYFAWASDNDARDSTWVTKLVGALDAHPEAVLAYSKFGLIENGEQTVTAKSDQRWIFDSSGVEGRLTRLRATTSGMRAGTMMYGLHRRRMLEKAGGVPSVMLSDFMLLSYLSLHGTFVQVPEVLWYRELTRRTGKSRERQVDALFADAPPWSARLPPSYQHTLWLARTLVSKERRPDGMGVAEALVTPGVYYLDWGMRYARRWRLRLRKAVGRRWKRWLKRRRSSR
jgi:glycosyltransferase involved in cell wall biosynthesis